MPYLRQSTTQTVRFGPFLDSTDGVTAETALTIAQADMQLSKDGGAFAQKNAAGNATHDQSGWYSTSFNTTDTNTVGELILDVQVSGALAVWLRYWVLEEAIYDSLFGASAAGFDGNQRVDVGEWLGTAVTSGTGGPDVNVNAISDDTTAAQNAEAFFDGTGYAGTGNTIPTVTTVSNQVTADVTAISGDTVAANNLEADYDGTGFNKSNSTIGTCTTNTDMRGTDNALLAASAPTNFGDMAITVTTGQVTVGANNDKTGYSISGTKTTLDALNDVSTSDVKTQADTALTDVNLDHLVGTATAIPALPAGTYFDQMLDDGTATFDRTTDSLQALRDRGDAAWTTGGGGSITDILHVVPLIPESIDLANTVSWRLGLMLTNAVDDLPSTAEIDPGTISIDRKAIGGTSWSAVVTDSACSESAGLVYFDEVFDSGTGYAEGDSIRITFKSQKITVAANDYEVSDATGRIFYTEVRQTMRGTNSASTHTAADVWTSGTRTLTANTNLNDPTAVAIRQEMDSNSTQLAAIVGDTNELQGDWANGGRLDTILDARAAQTTADAIEVDTQDIQSRLPAALVSGRMSSDAVAIAGSADAANKLSQHARVTYPVTFTGGTTTTAVLDQVDGSAASSTDDLYNGRLLVFNAGTLEYVVAEITDYDGATTTATISQVPTAVTAAHTARLI